MTGGLGEHNGFRGTVVDDRPVEEVNRIMNRIMKEGDVPADSQIPSRPVGCSDIRHLHRGGAVPIGVRAG
ncbi:hypothetical protein [Nocardia paucivorans]|uniref:hypothetical protein n=1 Tax=Nocardia paucivorans TaxID=114259 RepID=UPI0005943A11|nr:hypothetical protein [Nocardia paucivorans]